MRCWRRSGLTGKVYAQRHGLRAGTLYCWSVRLNRTEPKEPARFIEVAARVSSPLELRIGANVTVRIEPGFDAGLLREVLAALVSP